jgi:hypothetical protein
MYLHIVDLCLRQYCMQFFDGHSSVMFLKIIILCGTFNTEIEDKVILTSTDFHDVYKYIHTMYHYLIKFSNRIIE